MPAQHFNDLHYRLKVKNCQEHIITYQEHMHIENLDEDLQLHPQPETDVNMKK